MGSANKRGVSNKSIVGRIYRTYLGWLEKINVVVAAARIDDHEEGT